MEINRSEPGTGAEPQNPRPAEVDAPQSERRSAPRTTMSRIICFDMGASTGGVVTDVCPRGMGLRADLPMDNSGEVSFALLVDGSRLRGSGEIMWMDQARKVCGIRFTSVTPALGLQLNRWFGQAHASRLRAAEPIRSDAVLGLTTADAQTSVAEATGNERPPLRDTFLTDDWAKQEERASNTRSRAFGGGVVTGFLLAVIVAGVLFYSGLVTWRSASHILPPAQNPTAPLPPASASSSRPAAPSADIPTAPSSPTPAAPATPPADSSAREQNANAPVSSDQGTRQSSQAQEPASSHVDAAPTSQSALDEANTDLRIGRSQEAAKLLWSAVSEGNVAAETQLADLYLRGNGVAKSCVQGRVLLTAAAKKGNIDAQHRLSELQRTGCR